MVNVGRAVRRAPSPPAPGAVFDIRIARVVLDGVPAIAQEHLAAAIQASVTQAMGHSGALLTASSSNVAFAVGETVQVAGPSFASQVGGAIAPVVLGSSTPSWVPSGGGRR